MLSVVTKCVGRVKQNKEMFCSGLVLSGLFRVAMVMNRAVSVMQRTVSVWHGISKPCSVLAANCIATYWKSKAQTRFGMARYCFGKALHSKGKVRHSGVKDLFGIVMVVPFCIGFARSSVVSVMEGGV